MSWSKWSICKGNRCQSCVSLWECVCVSLHCLTLLTSYLTSIRVLSRLVNDALWGPQWRFCFFPAFTTLPLSLAQPHRLPVQTQYFSFGSLCLCVSHLVRNTDSFIITTAFSTDSSFIDPLVKDVMEPGHNSRGVCVCGGGCQVFVHKVRRQRYVSALHCCCSCCCHGVGASYPHGRSRVFSGRGEVKRPVWGFAPTTASATCSAGAELIASDNRPTVCTVSTAKKFSSLQWRLFEDSLLRWSLERKHFVWVFFFI